MFVIIEMFIKDKAKIFIFILTLVSDCSGIVLYLASYLYEQEI